jgi:hypothetical protein
VNEPTDVTRFRRRFVDAVSRNEISLAGNWARPCHAVNVQAELDSRACDGLERAQDLIVEMDPALLRCPRSSLHVSIDWPLEVQYEYARTKASLLEEHRTAWVSGLEEIVPRSAALTLRYRWVVVTNSAVIALAEPNEALTQLRHAIRAELFFPQPVRPAATIVHTTLFRFSGVLDRPDSFLRATAAIDLDVTTTVTALVLSEELVYPSLTTRTLARFEFGARAT